MSQDTDPSNSFFSMERFHTAYMNWKYRQGLIDKQTLQSQTGAAVNSSSIRHGKRTTPSDQLLIVESIRDLDDFFDPQRPPHADDYVVQTKSISVEEEGYFDFLIGVSLDDSPMEDWTRGSVWLHLYQTLVLRVDQSRHHPGFHRAEQLLERQRQAVYEEMTKVLDDEFYLLSDRPYEWILISSSENHEQLIKAIVSGTTLDIFKEVIDILELTKDDFDELFNQDAPELLVSFGEALFAEPAVENQEEFGESLNQVYNFTKSRFQTGKNSKFMIFLPIIFSLS